MIFQVPGEEMTKVVSSKIASYVWARLGGMRSLSLMLHGDTS